MYEDRLVERSQLRLMHPELRGGGGGGASTSRGLIQWMAPFFHLSHSTSGALCATFTMFP